MQSRLKLTSAVENKILNRLVEGRSLRSICRDVDIPVTPAAVRKAAGRDSVFGTQYARARELGIEEVMDEILEIVDDSRGDWILKEGKDGVTRWVVDQKNIQRSRMRCDARKWHLSKILPKKRASRQCCHINGMSQQQIEIQLSQILRAAEERSELLLLQQ